MVQDVFHQVYATCYIPLATSRTVRKINWATKTVANKVNHFCLGFFVRILKRNLPKQIHRNFLRMDVVVKILGFVFVGDYFLRLLPCGMKITMKKPTHLGTNCFIFFRKPPFSQSQNPSPSTPTKDVGFYGRPYGTMCFACPKNPWTLQWKGLILYRRGPGPQNRYFWGVRILRVGFFGGLVLNPPIFGGEDFFSRFRNPRRRSKSKKPYTEKMTNGYCLGVSRTY